MNAVGQAFACGPADEWQLFLFNKTLIETRIIDNSYGKMYMKSAIIADSILKKL